MHPCLTPVALTLLLAAQDPPPPVPPPPVVGDATPRPPESGLPTSGLPAPSASTPQVQDSGQPLVQVQTVAGATRAIRYKDVKRAGRIDFRGTSLLPDAKGSARVKARGGATEIRARFEGLPDPGDLGPGCLAYVLWAVSPEGRVANLGEIPLRRGKGELRVTEALPAFALMVTAEPHFAVTAPSDAVVLENAVRKDMDDRMEEVPVTVALVRRSQYAPVGEAQADDPKAAPLLRQARNAVRIARNTGAGGFAGEALAHAEDLLKQAEEGRLGRRDREALARQAVLRAEDARTIALSRQDEIRQARLRHQQDEERVRMARLEAEEKARQAASAAASARADRDAALTEVHKVARTNEQLRSQLMSQLNTILETRATMRGLIVNLPGGVTFATGKSTLAPGAREKLARIAGVLLANRGLKVEAEGYTDSTGGDAFNQALSERRAEAVRGFLIRQGVPKEAIVARGLGKSNPLVPETSAEARRTNRRVELVISGEGLEGRDASAPSTEPSTTP